MHSSKRSGNRAACCPHNEYVSLDGTVPLQNSSCVNWCCDNRSVWDISTSHFHPEWSHGSSFNFFFTAAFALGFLAFYDPSLTAYNVLWKKVKYSIGAEWSIGNSEMLFWCRASLKLACVPLVEYAKTKTSAQLFFNVCLHYMQFDFV